jgi:ATP-binding cassette subfamily B protein
MASLRNILSYYRNYQKAAFLSIGCLRVSLKLSDLMVPYAVGQILNVLSHQPLDGFVQSLVDRTMSFNSLCLRKVG